jgi:phosphoribosylanthranilate isomerase
MRNSGNIVDLANLNPDYLGLIFYQYSKRYVGNLDKVLLNSLPQSIKLTGVFVDEEIEEVIEMALEYNLNALQLHGSESVAYCQQLKNDLSIKAPSKKIDLLKAFGISSTFNFGILKPYNDVVDYFLFDTKTEGHGGSGLIFDWRKLEDYKEEKPFFLSGGLSLENIQEVHELALEHLYGVDLNSKFEIEPGLKDIESLQSAFDIIRK